MDQIQNENILGNINKELSNLKFTLTENSNLLDKLSHRIETIENNLNEYKKESNQFIQNNLNIAVKELEKLSSHVEEIDMTYFNPKESIELRVEDKFKNEIAKIHSQVQKLNENYTFNIKLFNQFKDQIAAHLNKIDFKSLDSKIENAKNETIKEYENLFNIMQVELENVKCLISIQNEEINKLNSSDNPTKGKDFFNSIEMAIDEIKNNFNDFTIEIKDTSENLISQFICFKKEINDSINLKNNELENDFFNEIEDIQKDLDSIKANLNFGSVKQLDDKIVNLESVVRELEIKIENILSGNSNTKISTEKIPEIESQFESGFIPHAGHYKIKLSTSEVNESNPFLSSDNNPNESFVDKKEKIVPESSPDYSYNTQIVNFLEDMNIEENIQTHENVYCLLFLSEYTERLILATGHKDGAITLWDIKSFELIKKFLEHKNVVEDLQFIGISYIISASRDKTIKLWDLNCNNSIRTFLNDAWTFCIATVRYYRTNIFVTGDENSNIKFWNIESENTSNCSEETIKSGHKHGVSRILYLSDVANYNMILTSSCPDIKLWNLFNKECLRTYNEHNDWINGLIYLRSDIFCSASADKTIRIWNIFCSKSIKLLNIHTTNIASLISLKEFCGDDLILTGSLGKSSKIFNFNNENVIKVYQRDQPIYKMDIMKKNNKIIIFGCYWASRTIKIWGNIKYLKLNLQ